MDIEQHLEKKAEQLPSPSAGKQWRNTFLLSIVIFSLGSIYLSLRRWDYDLYIANKVFATTALVLIGLSLALSGLCYFWDFADDKILYRKYLGLTGFAFAVIHVVTSVFLLPDHFPYPEWFFDNMLSVFLGGTALLLLSFLALISNRTAMTMLGSKYWRLLLRLGYLAFILIIAHLAILKYPGWIRWMKNFDPILPPLSLLEFIFALLVITLRIAVWIDLKAGTNQE